MLNEFEYYKLHTYRERELHKQAEMSHLCDDNRRVNSSLKSFAKELSNWIKHLRFWLRIEEEQLSQSANRQKSHA
jgi:hypothetical protein